MDQGNSSSWFLGIDLGTGSCKSIVVDERGYVLGIGVGGYAADNVEDKWQEQDPDALVEGLIASVQAAVSDAAVAAEGCVGMSVGGALHSLLAVDEAGRALTGVMTWADNRAQQQAERVGQQPEAEQLYRETGCPIHGMYPLYKIMWLREERPQIFARARRFVSAKEYVMAQLTGEYVVDYSIAAGSGLLHVERLQWNERSLRLGGIDESQLSHLAPPRHVFAGLTPDMSARMGIPADTPIVLGSSDAANSSIGAGAVTAERATCMLGTSGAYRIITRQPILDSDAKVWCYAIDAQHWLVGGAINNGGLALSWLLDLINELLPQASHLSFDDLLQVAEEAGTGAKGVICLPFFAGERSPNWNLNARALFFGMTLQHGAGDLARALLEGIAFRLRSVKEMLAEAGLDVQQIRASGGFTRSESWMQLVANVLNRELVVPSCEETSAFGAAFWAMLAQGQFDDLEEMADFVEGIRFFQPDADHAASYDRLYLLYRDLYERMRVPFDQIAEVQREAALIEADQGS